MGYYGELKKINGDARRELAAYDLGLITDMSDSSMDALDEMTDPSNDALSYEIREEWVFFRRDRMFVNEVAPVIPEYGIEYEAHVRKAA